MRILDLLEQKQTTIKQRWLDLIVETYPADAREFLKRKKDRFSNPVGTTLSRQVDSLFEIILEEDDSRDVTAVLEEFIKIRSIQEFSPSQAISFILLLKQATREILSEDIRTHQLFTELLNFESRLDNILLKAFDLYSASREKLLSIRMEELKRSSYVALKRINKAGEDQNSSPEAALPQPNDNPDDGGDNR
jgi:hypothetical protein